MESGVMAEQRVITFLIDDNHKPNILSFPDDNTVTN